MSLDLIYFSYEDVDKLLEKLKTKNTPSGDTIHRALLQIFIIELNKPVYIIFDKALQEKFKWIGEMSTYHQSTKMETGNKCQTTDL